MIPFHSLFPQLLEKETRIVTVLNNSVIPDDHYILTEFYCGDPNCDCRRVLLKVIAKANAQQGELLTVSFGFDRDGELAGPYIDPLNPRCSYADAIFRIIAPMLETDSDYTDRLESHYRMVRDMVSNPTPRVRALLARCGPNVSAPGSSRPNRSTKRTPRKRKRAKKRRR